MSQTQTRSRADDIVSRLAAEFAVSEEQARALADPKVVERVARETPPSVSSMLGKITGTIIWLVILAPVIAFLVRLSFSAASHMWGLATF